MPDTTTQRATEQLPASQPAARDFRQEVTNDIIRLLEQGVAPWQKPWQPGAVSLGMQMNPTTSKTYRGGNAVHLMATGLRKGYADPRWMTYRQASERGWQVRQGEKGTQIEFWEVKSSADRTRPRPPDDRDEGRMTADGGMDRDKTRLVHRVYTVFNAKQMDGIPVYAPKQHAPFEAVQAGEQILENSGAQLVHDQVDRAFYNRAQDRIHLPPKEAFKDAASYYGTVLHELAHFSGHPSRLNRPTLTESYHFGDINYAKEELRAELASVFLAAERGIPHNPEQHAAYVGSWIQVMRQDKHEIFRAAHDASAIADYLLALERERSLDPERPAAEPALTPGSIPSAGPHPVQGPEHGKSGSPTQPNELTDSLTAAQSITAESLGNSARMQTAQTESGIYRGVIIGETACHVIQRQSAHSGVAHLKNLLDGQPQVGDHVRIHYANSKGTVREFRERAKTVELGR
jgi:antirestriction protein ArdC